MSLIKEALMIKMMSLTLPLVATDTCVWANGKQWKFKTSLGESIVQSSMFSDRRQ
jgi:hypothetical protein